MHSHLGIVLKRLGSRTTQCPHSVRHPGTIAVYPVSTGHYERAEEQHTKYVPGSHCNWRAKSCLVSKMLDE